MSRETKTVNAKIKIPEERDALLYVFVTAGGIDFSTAKRKHNSGLLDTFKRYVYDVFRYLFYLYQAR